MGTKNQPGQFDCYAAADPDEPLFVLRANDPDAPEIVEEWVARRARRFRSVTGRQWEKLNEALQCAAAMRGWRMRNCSAQPCGCDAGAAYTCEGHRE